MSDWIEHDGTCCPVPVGTWVQVKTKGGRIIGRIVQDRHHVLSPGPFRFSPWFWAVVPEFCGHMEKAVVAYRIPSSKHVDKIKRSIKSPVEEMA